MEGYCKEGSISVVKTSNIWKSNMSSELKIRLLETSVFSISTYVCDSGILRLEERKTINAFEMWCHRRLIKAWVEKKANQLVLCSLDIQNTYTLNVRIAK